VTGLVTIEKIELAYDSIATDRCPPGASNNPLLAQFLVVQPVWVFSGHTEDGRLFEVVIQALPDEYLP
jgi:hypothetical protein